MTDRNIEPSAITAAPIETGDGSTVPVRGDPLVRDPRLDQELGFLGNFFGHGDTARTNIAGGTALVFTLFLAICFFGSIMAGDPEVRQKLSSMITPLFGVITGALGYITGKKS